MAKYKPGKPKKPRDVPKWMVWGSGIILVLMVVSMVPSGDTAAASQAFLPGIDDDAIRGDPYAPVTIISFSDYECSYCRTADQTLTDLMSQYPGDVRYVFRDLPLSETYLHAQKAAEAAQCAGAQGKYWEMHDKLFSNQAALDVDSLKTYAADIGLDTASFNTCLDTGAMVAEVLADQAEGLKAGVDGVPFFFINGRKLKGAQPLESFKAIIDEELSKVR